MTKAKKRSAKSSSKRAAAKASKRGSAGRKKVTKTKKRSGLGTGSKLKRTAKKAVKEAAVAAGLAAVGTVLTELGAGEKKPTSKRSDAEEKH